MNNVFKAELYKMRKSKSTLGLILTFIGFSALELAFLLVLKYFFSSMYLELGENGTILGSIVTYANSAIFRYGSLIYIAGMVTHMYTSGPMKQLVATGNSRRSVVVGQFCAFGFSLSVIAIVCGIIDAFCSNLNIEFGSVDAIRYILSILGMLAVVWCLAAFCLFFTHLLNNVGAAIAVGLVIIMGGDTAIGLLAAALKINWLPDYWIFNMFSSATNMSISTMEQVKYILIVAALAIVFIELTALVFKQKEIK